ncbi:hypothetical protein NECAME_19397 [Necator americanus]|uniref:Uncharacterized protein n=1 Tax=Necator americanus TaxID=51031 RepID=W2SRH4_NECAM|nr:hypothetical protein NECAME_19397 [Necator americanus]ETN71272.1 hypothetical protein NECAME_19397 [Necator americanus]
MAEDLRSSSFRENRANTSAAMRSEQVDGLFDPRCARTMEPIFPMKEADWSQYVSTTNNERDRGIPHDRIHGYGFASNASNSENEQVHQRYREASDSEWDSCDVRKDSCVLGSGRMGSGSNFSRHARQTLFYDNRAPETAYEPGTSTEDQTSQDHLYQNRGQVEQKL